MLGNGFRKINKRGLSIFFLSAVLGLLLILVSFFVDTEALFSRKIGGNITGGYGLGFGGSSSSATIKADQAMSSFRCPVLITQKDQAKIKASVSNQGEKEAIRILHFTISNEYGQEEDVKTMTMAPGEEIDFSWNVSTENARYGFLILSRVFLNPYANLPSEGSTCGILVLQTDQVRGSELIWGFISLVGTGMLTGMTLFIMSNRPITVRRFKTVRSVLIVFVVVILGLGLTFFEFWYASLLMAIISILMVPAVYLDLFSNH